LKLWRAHRLPHQSHVLVLPINTSLDCVPWVLWVFRWGSPEVGWGAVRRGGRGGGVMGTASSFLLSCIGVFGFHRDHHRHGHAGGRCHVRGCHLRAVHVWVSAKQLCRSCCCWVLTIFVVYHPILPPSLGNGTYNQKVKVRSQYEAQSLCNMDVQNRAQMRRWGWTDTCMGNNRGEWLTLGVFRCSSMKRK